MGSFFFIFYSLAFSQLASGFVSRKSSICHLCGVNRGEGTERRKGGARGAGWWAAYSSWSLLGGPGQISAGTRLAAIFGPLRGAFPPFPFTVYKLSMAYIIRIAARNLAFKGPREGQAICFSIMWGGATVMNLISGHGALRFTPPAKYSRLLPL